MTQSARDDDLDYQWGLDATGNWSTFTRLVEGTLTLSQSRSHNKVNEIDTDPMHGDADNSITETVGTAWADPVQDALGNMTTVPKPSSLATGLTLKYDAWNRLVEVKEGANVVGKYEYDGDGRRIKKHIDTQSPESPNGVDHYEHTYYAGEQVVETRETDTVGAEPETLLPKYQWLWSPRYIDAPILRDKNDGEDSLCDDGRIYYLTDANMNVTALVDTAGDAVERCTYDPYGAVTFREPGWSVRSSSSYANSTLYTGRTLDGETGLYFYRARYYSAELGRFLARDPIGYSGGINLYEYVGASPLVWTDPMGHGCWCPPYRPQPLSQNPEFLLDFLTGGGATNRVYPPGSVQLQDMQQSPGAAKLRNKFYASGCKGVSAKDGNYGHWEAAWETGPFSPSHWDHTDAQVGGFGGATAVDNGDGTVTFTINNEAGLSSFCAGFITGIPNRTGTTGPMRTIHQTFQWTETIDKSKCCPKK